MSLVSAEEMRDFVDRWVERSYSQEEAAIDREFLLLLDFIHEKRDVWETVRARYTGVVVGFYDSDSQEILVLSEGDGKLHPDTKRVFAHEIVHALQDEAFDLSSLYPDKWFMQDSLLARKALVEGDARYFDRKYGGEYLTEEEKNLLGTSNQSGVAREPSTYVHDNLAFFPYSYGADFASRIEAHLGIEALNQAYADLPMSTEQILHPEKYLAREAPIIVELPDIADLAGPGWEILDTGVIGELLFDMHLHTYSNFSDDRPSAAGWGGDKYALLRNSGSGETALVSKSKWDSVHLAQTFFNTYEEAAEKSADWLLTHSGESVRRWSGRGRMVHLEKHNDTVLLIIGNSQSTVETISTRVSPY